MPVEKLGEPTYHDVWFPIFSNASNAGLPSLAKKIMANGESEIENSKQVLGTIFYLNRLFSHRATKTWGRWKLFLENLFSSTICEVSNDSKWFTSESLTSFFIQSDHQQKSSCQFPQSQQANFDGSQHVMTTLIL